VDEVVMRVGTTGSRCLFRRIRLFFVAVAQAVEGEHS